MKPTNILVNKSICVKCAKQNKSGFDEKISEEWWERHCTYFCPEKGSWQVYVSFVPDTCPYKVEHLVMGNIMPKRAIEICEGCKSYSRMFDPANEKNGYVSCKEEGMSRKYAEFFNVSSIPEDCPYKLEHLVIRNG